LSFFFFFVEQFNELQLFSSNPLLTSVLTELVVCG